MNEKNEVHQLTDAEGERRAKQTIQLSTVCSHMQRMSHFLSGTFFDSTNVKGLPDTQKEHVIATINPLLSLFLTLHQSLITSFAPLSLCPCK